LKLYDPGTLKAFLGKHGISASKGLGQHFLCSRSVVESISNSIAGCNGVLEIGPGPGVLTGPISEQSQKMIALELDHVMIQALHESAPMVDARRVDALKADLSAILAELPEPRGIVSNMPYYITGPLLNKVAEARSLISVAVLMMQKEVAQRIMAAPGNGDRGSLSVFLQMLFDISLVVHVPAGSFVPPPKVDSTVLRFVPRALAFDPDFEARLFRLIRLSFAQPRKTLANNLVAGLHIPRESAIESIESANLEEKVRPHDLSLDQWVALAKAIS
jgi:16S rRNA (adenine1518-N6/adenine1519-N6)-dimethyltransferase